MDRHLTLRAGSQAAVWAAAVAAAGLAWAGLGAAAVARPHHADTHPESYFQSAAMWLAMMVAMMAPAVAPWIAAYARLIGRGAAPALLFVAGYAVVWSGYSLAVAALQTGLAQSRLLHAGALDVRLGGAILVGAGLYQLSPVRGACLTHCRNPLTYFLARWRDGPIGGFRLGVEHGAWCVGCCWALMLTGFALGVMNLAWMAVLTLLIGLEQLSPAGARVGRLAGGGFVVWGLLLLR